MSHMNDKIETTLNELALVSELLNENPFKTKAYKNAAFIAQSLPPSLEEIKNVKGIGKGIFSIIEQIYLQKEPKELTELKNKVPGTLFELFKVNGLGPKRIKQLWQDLGIKSVGELLYACKENRLETLKGFGKAMQTKILEEAESLLLKAGKIRLDQAFLLSEALGNMLSSILTPQKICLAGKLNRKEEIIDEIDFVVLIKNIAAAKKIIDENFTNVSFDETTHSLSFEYLSVKCRLYLVLKENLFGLVSLIANGDEDFLSNLKPFADKKGLTLSLCAIDHERDFSTEENVFDFLDLYFVEPEQRHKHGLIVQKGKIKPKLITLSDLRGAFHNHTVASDGKNTLLEMKEMAKAMNLSYISINDHSKSAFYAQGLKEDTLSKQTHDIHALNEKDKDFFIFSGSEVDILKDGQLDYENEDLANLDIVVASVHRRFKQTYDEMTNRMLKALENPYVTMLGHPTGRLILSRNPSAFDMEQVIIKAKEQRVVLELNAHPQRLDLNEEHLRMAKQHDVLIAINADAHSTEGLKDLSYGIMIAQRAGLEPNDVFNCLSIQEVKTWLSVKRKDLT